MKLYRNFWPSRRLVSFDKCVLSRHWCSRSYSSAVCAWFRVRIRAGAAFFLLFFAFVLRDALYAISNFWFHCWFCFLLTSDSTVCFVFLPNTPACYCTCSSPLSLPQPPTLDSTSNSPHSFVHLLFQFIMWIRIIPTAIKSPKVTTFVTARPRAVAASVAVAVSVMPNH